MLVNRSNDLLQMHRMRIVWSPANGIICWLAALFEPSCQLKRLCEYLSVWGKRMGINILLNGFQLCSKQSVPCRETETQSSCHVTTKSSQTQCWTCFHTETRSKFFTRHRSWEEFTATCHSQCFTHVWQVDMCGGFLYTLFNLIKCFTFLINCILLC